MILQIAFGILMGSFLIAAAPIVLMFMFYVGCVAFLAVVDVWQRTKALLGIK